MQRKHRLFIRIISISLCGLIFLAGGPARADIAPPEPPPGSNVGPGQEVTQVQMMWEKVAILIYALPPQPTIALAGDVAAARVTATFSMRNQGSAPEQIPVRFPLANPNGWGDGTTRNYPEIPQIAVKVDNVPAATSRVTTPNPSDPNAPPVAWAQFDASFPPAEDVTIEVQYVISPQGDLPFGTFHYTLETGAGWKGPIGMIDLIVGLPYAANNQNVLMDPDTYPRSSPGGTFAGNAVTWHYENLEPTLDVLQELMRTGNGTGEFEVSVLLPTYWRDILNGRAAVAANGQDGQAWGQLARACKLAIQLRRGLRSDAAGQQLYAEAVAAYEQAVTLVPKEARWHAGYAELLWQAYFYSSPADPARIVRAVQELKAAVALEPGNQQAKNLLDEISLSHPEFVKPSGTGYTFLVLTTTPTAQPTDMPTVVLSPTSPTETQAVLTEQPATPTAEAASLPPATSTPLRAATLTEQPSPTLEAAPLPGESATPASARGRVGLPCGAAALPLFGIGLWLGARYPGRKRFGVRR
jgi:hypothetical protein